MVKVFVVAKHWDSDKNACVDHIVGEFRNFVDAELFKRVFDEWYHAESRVVSEEALLDR